MPQLPRALVGICALALSACRSIPPALPPPCDKPAPLVGSPHRESPGVGVSVRRGHPNPEIAAGLIAARNNLGRVKYLPLGNVFFILDETPALLAKLRCDEDVEFLQYIEPVVIPVKASSRGT
jgi:hypothetical protein